SMKILQFGEGNFLRAFVDAMIDTANEKGVMNGAVTIVKPIAAGDLSPLRAQNCVYTLLVRGMQNGNVIDEHKTIHSVKDALCCYQDFDAVLSLACDEELTLIVSNTTEAGIALSPDDCMEDCPPVSYPAKLTKLLWARYEHFAGALDKGLYILPCELISDNARELERCVLETAKRWQLPAAFSEWIQKACFFCTTLVDSIVTGYDRELSEKYGDPMIDIREPFALWVIEEKGDICSVLPLDKAGLPVVFTRDVTPYRERKVRILNGAHTATVLAAYLAGKTIVRECMQDEVISSFMKNLVYDEIIPTLSLDKEELSVFAEQVFERFENPFIDHSLLSISLNSVSKFRARLLGSFRDYVRLHQSIPRRIAFAFAALIAFYCDTDKSKDDEAVLAYFAAHKKDEDFVGALCANEAFWGEDLSRYEGFCETVQQDLNDIREKGAYEVMKCL
ncbi:MAG: tagaturonate reductase, partial [Clostridiales bacterium]|nr:tagaturonate reductase [Clostridiales bacterium]